MQSKWIFRSHLTCRPTHCASNQAKNSINQNSQPVVDSSIAMKSIITTTLVMHDHYFANESDEMVINLDDTSECFGNELSVLMLNAIAGCRES